jgi:hypothetical protein
MLNELMQPTLANVFQVLECIEFNMVENQIVTLKFNMDVPWNLTNSSQLGSSQCNPLTKFKVPQKKPKHFCEIIIFKIITYDMLDFWWGSPQERMP